VVELHLPLTQSMQRIQSSVLDLINFCIKEMKRVNPTVRTSTAVWSLFQVLFREVLVSALMSKKRRKKGYAMYSKVTFFRTLILVKNKKIEIL